MPDPKQFLNIVGTVSKDTSNGYTRFFGVGPIQNFVGVESAQIQPGSNIQVSQPGNAVVPILSRLALSDYPTLPPPLTIMPRPGPIFPVSGPVLKAPIIAEFVQPVEPRKPGALSYFLTDGTALVASDEDGKVIGLSTAKTASPQYSLTTSIGTTSPAKGSSVIWLYAYLLISKDGAAPFTFGFDYSAESFRFNVMSSQGNVENTIQVDLSAAVIENQSGNVNGTATLNRVFTYHNDIYANQSLSVPAITSDAQFHLPNLATLWPSLPDIALFADVFAQLGGQPPQLAQSPFVALGSLDFYAPPPSATVLSEQITSSIVPAFGPLAASCLSSDDQAVGLKAAAIWLADLLLSTATGKAAVQTVVQAYHNFLVQSQFGPSLSPTTNRVMPMRE